MYEFEIDVTPKRRSFRKGQNVYSVVLETAWWQTLESLCSADELKSWILEWLEDAINRDCNRHSLIRFRIHQLCLERMINDSSPVQEQDRIQQFRAAYDLVGKGNNYVYIFKIRRELGWPRNQFDEIFREILEHGYFAAHPGNPGALSADEVSDSYQDEFGDLYITVSWRRNC